MKRLRDMVSNGLSGALVLSLLVHGLIAAALLITLPLPEAEPEPEEQVIEVTLVEPQDVPEVEIEEPDVPEPELTEPEQPAEEAPAPEPPEPEAAAPEMPEPEASAEEPAPEPEQAAAADEQTVPPPGVAGEGQAVPIPVLRPVFQFGERDAGPREALDGASAEEPEQAEPTETEAATPPMQQTAEPEPEQSEPAEAAAGEPDPATAILDAVEAESQEPEIAGLSLPEITLPGSGLPQGGLPEPDPDAQPSTTGLLPEPRLGEPTASQPPADTGAIDEATVPDVLNEARQLFSTSISDNPAAMVAMGNLPRGLRASQLCTTELREQLRSGPEPYGLELLPSYRLDTGNVLTETNAAFRADGAWYSLSFRCTVDDDALKVTGFAHSVGAAIPRADWKARGFPDF
ncbi:protein of unknown function (DUF930) [Hoeflea sp. IMCC20628]|uniref:DUF930 domain-containing protein n=1 Tax=Hoeflea sp. IMCC20628 TaxID=1620421 RepID=UPI00063ADAF1|nr:DUF930 domain-containing protein [Hoeflea sp. IMCC20628]AKH99504.1 protein of unknown function (DUF930) [Hoeflea sp. IMCC20628]